MGRLIVAANGKVRTAPLGTTKPSVPSSTPDTDWGAGWVELGLMSEDGVHLTNGQTREEIPAWGLLYPARVLVSGRSFIVGMTMREGWSAQGMQFAFGGGSVTTVTGPNPGYHYLPPAAGDVDERMLGIDFNDGDVRYRVIVPTGLVSEDVETPLVSNAAADFPISFATIGKNDGSAPWEVFTNDPTFLI